MSQPGDTLNFDEEPPSKAPPWGMIAAVLAIVLIIAGALWVNRDKKRQESRTAVLAILEKELDAERSALEAQREKVVDLTSQVENLRASIQAGQVDDKRAAVDAFNKMAAQQRVERETFAKMAEAYNQKVAKYKQLQ
jgi:hypothetical protein